MGRAQIISESGDGLYTVEVKHDTSAAESTLTNLNASLTFVNGRLAVETIPEEIAFLKIRKTALEKQIERVTAAGESDYQVSAWCADLTTGLTGDVGTIEPAAEYKNGINIQPGYGGASAHNADRDGQGTPFLTMHVADAMRNFAAMPGIQKWRLTYRYGTLSNLDKAAGTCTVTLDAVASSIQALNVNHQTTFDNVSIDYMNCDAIAFANGDDVIVKWDPYHTDSDPVVIGFKDNPKPCDYILKLASINGVEFTARPNSYHFRITQPIPEEITHYAKGTYTEDFTVICDDQQCDNAGVAELTIIDGKTIDSDYPLNVQIRSDTKWTYWTEDWKGDAPDKGIKWPDNDEWTNYPTGDLSEYDYLVDAVPWITVDIDLRVAEKVGFNDAAGDPHTGFLVSPTGIKIIKQTYENWNVTDFSCNWHVDEQNFSHPVNTIVTDDVILKSVDLSKKPDGSYQDSYVLEPPYTNTQLYCNSDPGMTCDCYGVTSNKTARYIHPLTVYGDPGYQVPWQLDAGHPVILSNRAGVFIAFDTTTRLIDADWEYGVDYMWAEYVEGEDGHWCDPGQDTNLCGRSTGHSWETGTEMIWQAIDIDADNI